MRVIKEINVEEISRAVARLAVDACCLLPDDVVAGLARARQEESSSTGQGILEHLQENAALVRAESIPICQDTGLAVAFASVGQDVRIVGGDFESAIHQGVRRGYTQEYLRKSCVAEPLFERKNTGDNTPAVIHTRIVPGEFLHLRLAPKGAGSGNKSLLRMLVPADGLNGVRRVVLEAVKAAGPSACPPVVVGVGIGGTMEVAALCAKRAAARDLESRNVDARYATLEEELLDLVKQHRHRPAGIRRPCGRVQGACGVGSHPYCVSACGCEH